MQAMQHLEMDFAVQEQFPQERVSGIQSWYEYVFNFTYPFRDGTRPVGFASPNNNGNWLFAIDFPFGVAT